jgi:hypothetical protein
VAAVADRSRKIRGKPRRHPCRFFLSTREIHHRNVTRQPGNCFEERSASTATGATGRAVATRIVGVGLTLPGECQGYAPTPR